MKKVFWIASFAVALGACNTGPREEGTTTATDTTAHSARQDGTEGMEGMGGTGTGLGPIMGTDTASMAGGSLMSIMQTNMDQLKGMPSTGDPDIDFATMMRTHHMGSMEMARMEMAQGTDPQLKQMAQKMMDNQQKEAQELNQYVSGQGSQGQGTQGTGGSAFHQQTMTLMNNMKMDTAQGSGSVDQQFARLMSQHHQSGIDMAQTYIKHSQDERLKDLAGKIKSGQQKELQELKAWQGKNR